MFVKTLTNTLFVVLFIFILASSIYQSQKSSQIKLYRSEETILKSYLSIPFRTLLISSFSFSRIHLSHIVKFSNAYSSLVNPSNFIKTNLDAFHNLLTKFHVDFTFSSSYLKSCPGADEDAKKNLSEFLFLMIRRPPRSTPLPKLLLIFLP